MSNHRQQIIGNRAVEADRMSAAVGEPLPAGTIHAVSVSMPKWQDVIDYEEGNPDLMASLKTGYPRFVLHPLLLQLLDRYRKDWSLTSDQSMLLFPSLKVAEECRAYILQRSEQEPSDTVMLKTAIGNIVAVIVPEHLGCYLREFWQHAGLIVSSRCVEDILQGTFDWHDVNDPSVELLQKRLAQHAGASALDVYVTTSGMASIYYAYKVVTSLKKDATTIQLGFPYLDTLKIQQKGPNKHLFLNYRNKSDLETVKQCIEDDESISAVFCEFPTNPLLDIIDIEALSALLRPKNIALIVDDTLATSFNAHILPYADMVVTSLTKFFSGVGDVMAGSIILNEASPLYADIKAALDAMYEPLLYPADSKVLYQNSDNFAQIRLDKIFEKWIKDTSKIWINLSKKKNGN